jgi:hypothetical protein
MSATFDPPTPPPRNYFVPNFGVDSDIADTTSNLAEAESEEGHTMKIEEAADIKRNYFIPNFGVDPDILDSQSNLAQSETLLKTKMGDDYFKDTKSHKIDYFVPNFGQDTEIETSLDNTKKTEKALNHKWDVKVDKENVQLDADIQLESDPITSSLNKIT